MNEPGLRHMLAGNGRRADGGTRTPDPITRRVLGEPFRLSKAEYGWLSRRFRGSFPPSRDTPRDTVYVAGRRLRETSGPLNYDHCVMPTPEQVKSWIRRNEAARRADRAADERKSASERMDEAAALSRILTGLRDSVRQGPRARS